MTKAEAAPIAVIDLGSNSVRLVIYEGRVRAPVSRFNERRMCGVGREVARHGRLGSAGRACVADGLRRFVAIARAAGCVAIDVVATAAFRIAGDGQPFLTALGDELGTEITLLSGEAEARAAADGIACGFAAPVGIVGDLGGGSVEFAGLGGPAGPQVAPVSLPLGGLILAESLESGPDAARRLIDQHLADQPSLAGACRGHGFYLVGGSWRALARARMAITDHPLRVVHGYTLGPDEAVTLGRTMTSLAPDELARMPGFPRRRADTVQGAGLLLARAVEHLEPERVIFSATGLREGRLFASLDAATRAQDPLLAGARELGMITNRDPGIGAQAAIFTGRVLAPEPPSTQRVREAVCHVADSAWREHPETRAREAFLRLVQYPFLGLDHVDRVALAYAVFVRYEGRPDDPFLRRTLSLLPTTRRAAAEQVGLLLDLALRLSAGIPSILARTSLAREGDGLTLRADHPALLAADPSITGRLAAVARALDIQQTRIAKA